jgi:hypothetical protein
MDTPHTDPRASLDDIQHELEGIDPADAPDVAERLASELADLLEEAGPDRREDRT